MIEVSEDLKSYLTQDGRTFKAKLVSGSKEYGNSAESHIGSLKIEGTLGGDNIGFGNTGCAKLEVTLFDNSGVKISGNYLKVYIGADVNGAEQWVQLGEFKAEKPTIQNGAITFVGYDRMNETGGTYKSKLNFSQTVTAADVWAELCMGVTGTNSSYEALSSGLSAKQIKSDALSGYSYRTAMGYLAAYLGCNAIVNRFGKFEMRRIIRAKNEGIISPDNCETPETEEEDYQLGYIVCNLGEEKTPLKEGTGSRGFSCVCPLMTTARLKTLAEAYLCNESATSPIEFRVGSVNVIKGDFRIEVGDWLSYVDGSKTYVFPVMKHTFEFDGGIMNKVEAFGKTPEEESGSVLSLEERLKRAVNDKIYKTAESQTAVVRDFSKAINGALGLYETEITNADGSKQTYLHNTSDIADATYIATINAGGFAFATGTGCWNGGNPTFTSGMTAAGNAVMNTINTFKITAGQIEVEDLSTLKATIAGWNISGNRISKSIAGDKASYEAIIQAAASDDKAAFAICKTVLNTDGNEEKTYPFRVFYNGKLVATNAEITGTVTATEGKIGGWNIGSTYTGAKGILSTTGDYEVGMKTSGNSGSAAFYVRNTKNAESPFYVTNEGKLHATKAEITGSITATGGTIGGFTVDSAKMKFGTSGSTGYFLLKPSGTTGNFNVAGSGNVADWAMIVSSRFGIKTNGTLWASGANISGKITATSGSIGGFDLDNSRMLYGTIGSDSGFLLRPGGTSNKYTVAGNNTNNWALVVGSKFGVQTDGIVWSQGLVADGVLLTGDSAINNAIITKASIYTDLTIENNATLKLATDATNSSIVLRKKSNGVAFGIDTMYLRLFGKAVYLGDTSTAVTSDERLKTDINSFTPAHEAFFAALKPRSYKYVEGTSDRTHYGFVAQEVKNAIESTGLNTQQAALYVEIESDRENFDGVECALRYDEFIALNTHMIQKLYQEINSLKERIMQYENNLR